MTITAHITRHRTIVIEHETARKSHLPLPPVEPTPSLDLGAGIHAAFNIITSACELHHGLRAYATSKERGDNSMLRFCTEIQRMERGETGAGLVTLSTSRPLTQSYDTFYDELDRAGALEGNSMNDRWGFEDTSLPQFKYGYTGKRRTLPALDAPSVWYADKSHYTRIEDERERDSIYRPNLGWHWWYSHA